MEQERGKLREALDILEAHLGTSTRLSSFCDVLFGGYGGMVGFCMYVRVCVRPPVVLFGTGAGGVKHGYARLWVYLYVAWISIFPGVCMCIGF